MPKIFGKTDEDRKKQSSTPDAKGTFMTLDDYKKLQEAEKEVAKKDRKIEDYEKENEKLRRELQEAKQQGPHSSTPATAAMTTLIPNPASMGQYTTAVASFVNLMNPDPVTAQFMATMAMQLDNANASKTDKPKDDAPTPSLADIAVCLPDGKTLDSCTIMEFNEAREKAEKMLRYR